MMPFLLSPQGNDLIAISPQNRAERSRPNFLNRVPKITQQPSHISSARNMLTCRSHKPTNSFALSRVVGAIGQYIGRIQAQIKPVKFPSQLFRMPSGGSLIIPKIQRQLEYTHMASSVSAIPRRFKTYIHLGDTDTCPPFFAGKYHKVISPCWGAENTAYEIAKKNIGHGPGYMRQPLTSDPMKIKRRIRREVNT